MNDDYRAGTGDAFRDWDAAYVMGSLSADERRDYEFHLEGCESCAAAVAELAGLPALLSKVAPSEASALLGDGETLPPPVTLLPRLVHSVRRRHRRRVMASTLGLLAVAAAAAIVVVVPMLAGAPLLQAAGPSRPTTSVAPQEQIALSQVVPSPLRASVRLVPRPWGTRVEMDCRYAESSGNDGYDAVASPEYAMYVTDAAGATSQIATWTAGPGQITEPAGTTSLTPDQIASVDVRAVSTGAVLLRGSP
ncbi:MAG: zf-HC2 domain-containing protein [Lacisediminihabitans sp.]